MSGPAKSEMNNLYKGTQMVKLVSYHWNSTYSFRKSATEAMDAINSVDFYPSVTL